MKKSEYEYVKYDIELTASMYLFSNVIGTCPNCGAVIRNQGNYCWDCGAYAKENKNDKQIRRLKK